MAGWADRPLPARRGVAASLPESCVPVQDRCTPCRRALAVAEVFRQSWPSRAGDRSAERSGCRVCSVPAQRSPRRDARLGRKAGAAPPPPALKRATWCALWHSSPRGPADRCRRERPAPRAPGPRPGAPLTVEARARPAEPAALRSGCGSRRARPRRRSDSPSAGECSAGLDVRQPAGRRRR